MWLQYLTVKNRLRRWLPCRLCLFNRPPMVIGMPIESTGIFGKNSHFDTSRHESTQIRNVDTESTRIRNDDTESTRIWNVDTESTRIWKDDTESTQIQHNDAALTRIQHNDASSTRIQHNDSASTRVQHNESESTWIHRVELIKYEFDLWIRVDKNSFKFFFRTDCRLERIRGMYFTRLKLVLR